MLFYSHLIVDRGMVLQIQNRFETNGNPGPCLFMRYNSLFDKGEMGMLPQREPFSSIKLNYSESETEQEDLGELENYEFFIAC